MRKVFFIQLLMLSCAIAGAFDKTLRVDYIFSGDYTCCNISVAALSQTDGWYGRSVNMDSTPVKGNGRITMADPSTGKILYANAFSTLFQEWRETDEANHVPMAFENTFLLPMPESEAVVTVELYDAKGRLSSSFSHTVNPSEILIARKPVSSVPASYIYKGGDPTGCIDVAIIAEGYTESEMGLFYSDAHAAVDAILSHEPFASLRHRFNFLAVAAPSKDSGVSIPRESLWKDTPLHSHFDTFHSDRYLTTSHVTDMHDLLSGLPYEHVIILANTDTYGGGGIYNSYTLTTAHHALFRPVVVHEFGHSFGALADEYAYGDPMNSDGQEATEPWEQNITTKVDFESKWKDMMDAGVSGVGLYEGAAYKTEGVWRPAEDCRMNTNTAPAFCPVCQRALKRMIDFYTVQAE